MKKFLLSSLAIAFAIVLSSFTSRQKSTEDAILLYWFTIDGQYWSSNAVLASDATFINCSLFAPQGTGCGGGYYQCVAGFAAWQVDLYSEPHTLINDDQVPLAVPYKKQF